MLVNRRELVALAAGGVAAANAIAPASQAWAASGAKIKAIAFDGFPIIDPRPVAAKTEELFPGRGPAGSDIRPFGSIA
jgi:2-haloacid dehalogenase